MLSQSLPSDFAASVPNSSFMEPSAPRNAPLGLHPASIAALSVSVSCFGVARRLRGSAWPAQFPVRVLPFTACALTGPPSMTVTLSLPGVGGFSLPAPTATKSTESIHHCHHHQSSDPPPDFCDTVESARWTNLRIAKTGQGARPLGCEHRGELSSLTRNVG